MFKSKLMQVQFRWSRRAACAVGALLIAAGIPFQASKAQDFDHYQPLQSAGPIPEELRTASSQKYARDLAELGDSAKGRLGRARDNFLLQSNFVLDEMLLSGRVIFNDPVTEYVTRVKNLILRDHPDLQRAVRIYLVRSPAVNAFATNSGILLVNMGLLAHLRSEAELAFVLCHEIQHYIHKHPINSYVKGEELKNNARFLGLNTMDDYIAARTRYSRSLELTADDLGFELFRKSGYTLTAADGVFDMLDYADRPFDELPWDASFFEWEYLQFPAAFTKWPLDSIRIYENEEDTMSTHPNVGTRRAAIAEKVAAAGDDTGETFLIGTDLFLDMRKRCRFELCNLYLSQHAFEEAIYHSYLLLQEEPQSHYLRKCIAQAIYGFCTYRNARKFESVHLDADDVQGEVQQLLFFMESLDREAFTILAVHEVWKTYLEDTGDPELQAIAEDMLQQLFSKHRETTEWLAREKPAEMPELLTDIQAEKKLAIQRRGEPEVEAPEEAEEEAGEEAAKAARKDENDYLKWALTDLFVIPQFSEAWDAYLQPDQKLEEVEYISSAERARMDRRERLKGVRLGVDKIVLIQPLYKNVDLRSKIPVQYLASESALKTYKETLAEMAERNDLEMEFLENRDLQEDDIQRFNDVSTMLMWLSDHFGNDDKLNLVNFRQEEAQALIERYGTKYFAWNALVTFKDRLEPYSTYAYLAVGTVLLPLLPLAVVKVMLPVKKTLFVTMVFDLETSEVMMEDYHVLRAKDKNTITRSTLYDVFYQIKQKPK